MLAERFRHYLNEPPMAYLTRWRLQLGAQIETMPHNFTAPQGLRVSRRQLIFEFENGIQRWARC